MTRSCTLVVKSRVSGHAIDAHADALARPVLLLLRAWKAGLASRVTDLIIWTLALVEQDVHRRAAVRVAAVAQLAIIVPAPALDGCISK